jgi:hypothetical protein
VLTLAERQFNYQKFYVIHRNPPARFLATYYCTCPREIGTMPKPFID